MKTFVFVDASNLFYGGEKSLGWKIDFRKFRVYLKEKYGVEKAYLFIGYVPENQNLYRSLQEFGYVLIFKPIMRNSDGDVKGNVDAELVLQVMIDYNRYEKAAREKIDFLDYQRNKLGRK